MFSMKWHSDAPFRFYFIGLNHTFFFRFWLLIVKMLNLYYPLKCMLLWRKLTDECSLLIWRWMSFEIIMDHLKGFLSTVLRIISISCMFWVYFISLFISGVADHEYCSDGTLSLASSWLQVSLFQGYLHSFCEVYKSVDFLVVICWDAILMATRRDFEASKERPCCSTVSEPHAHCCAWGYAWGSCDACWDCWQAH